MRTTCSWALAASVVVGGLALVGCESTMDHEGAYEDNGRVQSLSNVPSDRPVNTPTITPEMQRFDAGIGDTGTGTGGGGDSLSR